MKVTTKVSCELIVNLRLIPKLEVIQFETIGNK